MDVFLKPMVGKIVSQEHIWEYYGVHLDACKLDINETLNELGALKWELITAQWNDDATILSCIFKRIKR